MYRVNSKVVYDRKNGNILSSKRVSPPIAAAFDLEGLFTYYNATYGLADLTEDFVRTPEVVTTIKYHTVLQAAEFLKGDVGVNGAQGDEDQYWRNYAITSLILEPYEDAINPISDAFLTSASTAIHLTCVNIPSEHLIGFGIITTVSLLWWLTLMRWMVRSKVVTPNSSTYPEIDFGSKCVQAEDERTVSSEFDEQGRIERIEGLGGVLLPLSNATSADIVREITNVRIHLGSERKSVQNLPHIILTTNINEVDDLVVGMKYN